MNRIDRLNAILIQLQSKRIVKAQEVAERFEISLRTVYRDIRALEEAGIPIGSEAGLGYYLMEGYKLPPVMFTEEEASAMLLSGKLLEQFADQSIRKNYSAALYKIRAILRTAEKDYIEDLDTQIQVERTFSQPQDTSENLSLLQQALANRTPIEVEYHAAYKNETRTRQLEPVGICFYAGAWHLVAWCRLRQAYRDFRTDRFQSIKPLKERYQTSAHPKLADYLAELRKRDKLERVVLRVDKRVYSYLTNHKYYLGFVGEKELEDCYEVEFMTTNLDYFARSILMYEDKASVVEPQEVRQLLKKMALNLSAHYS